METDTRDVGVDTQKKSALSYFGGYGAFQDYVWNQVREGLLSMPSVRTFFEVEEAINRTITPYSRKIDFTDLVKRKQPLTNRMVERLSFLTLNHYVDHIYPPLQRELTSEDRQRWGPDAELFIELDASEESDEETKRILGIDSEDPPWLKVPPKSKSLAEVVG
ncbi:MAG: hypothetical protein WC796_02335 [Candidatus Pacearchaeota archaeon]|jgi:hypothetical protein